MTVRDAATREEISTERETAELLDVEAGLRDVLLPTRYDGLAHALTDLLDPESGLAALVDDAMVVASRSPEIPLERPAFPATKTPVTPTRDTGPSTAGTVHSGGRRPSGRTGEGVGRCRTSTR